MGPLFPKFKTPKDEERFGQIDPALRETALALPFGATITSTLRTPEENAAVGGVSNSYHTRGNALDYRIRDLTPDQIAGITNHFGAKGYRVLNEGDHLHIQPGGGGHGQGGGHEHAAKPNFAAAPASAAPDLSSEMTQDPSAGHGPNFLEGLLGMLTGHFGHSDESPSPEGRRYSILDYFGNLFGA